MTTPKNEPLRSLADELPPEQRQLALLSHDLRSALGGITGGLRQIDQSGLDPESRMQLERAMQESLVLARLLDAALQGDARSEGAVPIRPEAAQCDITAFLTAQSVRWRAEASEKGIGFTLDLGPGLPPQVRISELRLNRAIGNVVSNAIKYTDRGGVVLQAQADPAGGLVITVRDSGPGFAPAALARAFEAYGRPEDSAKPGTGLGLHISKTQLEAAGASIAIRNPDSGGAEARISLPARLCLWPEAGARPAVPALPDLSGIRILLAEDNKTNQLVATQMLRSMNAEVTVASDGVEALAAFEKGRFDLALLDIEMPRMSGLDVLRAIRARSDDRARTPLVALTAYAMREHKERISAAGANGLIPKPLISIEDFGHALLGYLSLGPTASPEPAEARTRPGESPGAIDRATYDGLLASIGSESMGELLEKIREDLSAVSGGLEQGRLRQDLQLIRSNTHILISVGGAVGALGLKDIAEKLNAAAHAGNSAIIRELTGVCIDGITQTDAFLKQEQLRFSRPT